MPLIYISVFASPSSGQLPICLNIPQTYVLPIVSGKKLFLASELIWILFLYKNIMRNDSLFKIFRQYSRHVRVGGWRAGRGGGGGEKEEKENLPLHTLWTLVGTSEHRRHRQQRVKMKKLVGILLCLVLLVTIYTGRADLPEDKMKPVFIQKTFVQLNE